MSADTPKPFLLFAGDNYYPSGGWGDYHGSYETLADAQAALKGHAGDWGHVVDIRTLEQVTDEAGVTL